VDAQRVVIHIQVDGAPTAFDVLRTVQDSGELWAARTRVASDLVVTVNAETVRLDNVSLRTMNALELGWARSLAERRERHSGA